MTADEYIQAAPTLVLYDSLTKTRSVLEQYQNVLVSVSGGTDSDDMVNVVEHLKTERQRITYVWFDTGIEMAATKRHLAYLQEKYKIEIKREKGAMPVAGAVKSVGYPFYSKNFSESIYRLQRFAKEIPELPGGASLVVQQLQGRPTQAASNRNRIRARNEGIHGKESAEFPNIKTVLR